MKYIHFVDFDDLPAFFIETLFVKNFHSFGLMANKNCLDCWDTLIRLTTTPTIIEACHLNYLLERISSITSRSVGLDFYVDQLLPIFESVTILNLSHQKIHDDSGILECLSQLINLKSLNLRNNVITERGINKILLRLVLKFIP